LIDEAIDEKTTVKQYQRFVGNIFGIDIFFLRQRMVRIGAEAGFAFKKLTVMQIG